MATAVACSHPHVSPYDRGSIFLTVIGKPSITDFFLPRRSMPKILDRWLMIVLFCTAFPSPGEKLLQRFGSLRGECHTDKIITRSGIQNYRRSGQHLEQFFPIRSLKGKKKNTCLLI
jgi:hypothetical protein